MNERRARTFNKDPQQCLPSCCASLKVIQHDRRNFGEPQLPRGKQTAVTGDDAGCCVHQNLFVKTELRNAGGDWRNFGLRVSSRIQCRATTSGCPLPSGSGSDYHQFDASRVLSST
jgi:hypothetical protein